MEHVLVTGGTGFIGSHSVEALLEANLRVTVLDDFSSGRRENLADHPRLTVIGGDIGVQFAPAREGDIRLSATRNQRLVAKLGVAGFTPFKRGLKALTHESGKG